MKRFLAIFGICLGGLIVVLSGYLGVKYLLGDFEPEVINPENISFEQNEYFFDDGNNYTITISTTTEGVTETKVSLQLGGSNRETLDKKHWTDGVIIIPKVAYIGQPFVVELVKDNSYASEVQNLTGYENALDNWVKGGVSNIIAVSTNKLIAPATTTVYVDTPVLTTEMVFLTERVDTSLTQGFESLFKCVENSKFVNNAQEKTINAGATFYVGLKYYPSASAVKYSKITSTNLLVEYKTQILAKLEELGLTENNLYSQIVELCEQENQEITINDVINLQKQFVTTEGDNTDLNTFFDEIIAQFESSLKYNNIIEKGTQSNVTIKGKIAGTNIYEAVATKTLGTAEFYTYTFKNANVEDSTFESAKLQGKTILQALEEAYANNLAERKTPVLNVKDVEVDSVTLNGSIFNSLYTNLAHTIYAGKKGTNNKAVSYLNINLANSILSDVDLQDRLVNIGLRFEKKVGTNNWIDASADIKLKNQNHATEAYQIQIDNGGTSEIYYRPYGSAMYWEIYAEQYVETEFRAVIKYFISIDAGEYSFIDIGEANYPKFTLINTTSATENMVSWLNTNAVELNVITLKNVASAGDADVNKNEEYNLATNVNTETLSQNVYTTVKYFIYSENEGANKLSDYFETVNTEPITYIFADNSTCNLYELPSATVKLKSTTNIPPEDLVVKAIFLTIKTDINGAPILVIDDNNTPNDEGDDITRYNYVKYSATKDTSLERLSSINFRFKKAITSLAGKLTVLDNVNADTKDDDGVLNVAQNCKDVLSVFVSVTEGAETQQLKQAIADGKVSVVAKQAYNQAENYVTYSTDTFDETNFGMQFNLSTLEIPKDVLVTAYVVYNVAGVDYYFEIQTFKICADLTINGSFAITDKNNKVITGINHILLKTELNSSSELVQTITASLTDNTTISIEEENIEDAGKIRVSFVNFLNETLDSFNDWHLKSNNENVVMIDNGQGIAFVGNGEATISLFVNNDSTPKATLKFIIENDGYVSTYAYKDSAGETKVVSGFNGNNYVFNKTQFELSTSGTNNAPIKLWEKPVTASPPENYEGLLELWYTIGGTTIPLSFNVAITDASKDAFKAIFGEDFNSSNLNITIQNNLGQDATVNFVYTCIEVPTIQINVSLTLTSVISVSSVKVKYEDNSGNTQELQSTSNSSLTQTYTVYAGKQYTFTTQFADITGTAYYHKIDDGKFTKIFEGGTYTFADVANDTSYTYYVSNENLDNKTVQAEIGKLQHAITIIVKPNIVNTVSTYSAILKNDGTAEIGINEIFDREYHYTGDEEVYKSKFELTQTNDYKYDTSTGNIQFTFSETNGNAITNSKTLSLQFKYASKILAPIQFVITPQSFENNKATNLAQYNGEKAIIVVANQEQYTSGKLATAESQFDSANTIEINGNINEYIVGNAIVVSSENLFVDTKAYLDVSDSAGNITKYKIIISLLQYPFVNIKNTSSNLDVYKLFVGLGAEDLVEYYKQNNIYVGPEYIYGGGTIELSNTGEDSENLVYKPSVASGSGEITGVKFSFVGSSLSAGDYIEVSENFKTISTRVIGETTYLHVVMSYKVSSFIYSIPTIIKINQSQQILVNYEFDDVRDSTETNYGTDSYDETEMLKATTAFDNAVMEYVAFNEKGKAQTQISDERFTVQKYTESGYETDLDYAGGFILDISKVYVNKYGVWSRLGDEAIKECVTISENTLTFTKGIYDAIRVKVKVATITGGAVNYYYIQAGEVVNLDLYKYAGGAETITSSTDVLTATNGDIILVGENDDGTTNISYYLKEDVVGTNDWLKYIVVENDAKCTTVDNQITINISPNASAFTILIYTVYGKLATVTVNISAYYTYEKNSSIIYSGTKIDAKNIEELVTIKQAGMEIDGTRIKLSDKTDGLNLTKYTITTNETTNTNEIRFAHSKTDYIIEKLGFYVDITRTTDTGANTDDTLYIEISNVMVTASITTDFATNAKDLGERSENGGNITITSNDWNGLFTGLSIANLYDVTYSLIYNGNTYSVSDIKVDYSLAVGALTTSKTIDVTLRVSVANTDANEDIVNINIDAKAKIKVIPQYQVTINYSQGMRSSFNCEYVQAGSKLNLEGNNINGQRRITVTGNPSNIEYKVSGETIDANYQIESNSDGNIIVDILVNGTVYGQFVICVVADNPISIDASNLSEQTLYAGYGHEQPLNYVDIVVSVPTALASYVGKDVEFTIGESGTIVDGKCYITGSTSQKIRMAVEIANVKDVQENGIWATCEGTSVECEFTLAQRYSLEYYGYALELDHYENAIDLEKFCGEYDVVEQGYRYPIEVKYKSDLVKSNTTETYYYNVVCDIDLTLPQVEGETDINFVLNANENKAGLSLVSLLNIKDNLGNTFTQNHVINGETLSLSHQNTEAANAKDALGTLASIRIEPVTFKADTTSYNRDYTINPVGATNNGTIVTLTLTYTVKGIPFTKDIKIKVMPDTVYSVLNNNKTSTSNDSTENRLVFRTTGSIVLADASQNSENNQAYYIYAYGKYDDDSIPNSNMAQTLNHVLYEDGQVIEGGVGTYCSIYKDASGNLIFSYHKAAEFGDKAVRIKFYDNFGFTFNYYITLLAQTRIIDVSVKDETFFEGEAISVYNAGNTSATGSLGITVEDNNGNTETANIEIEEVSIASGVSYMESTSSVTLNYQVQDFWKNSLNGLSETIQITFSIKLSGSTSNEVYVFTRQFVLYRRFEASVKEENTYVRDNVPFYIENHISVYDYKIGAYLGEPTLDTAEALELNFGLNSGYTVSTPSALITTYKEDNNATLSLTNFNVYELMKSRASGIYSVTGTFELTSTSGVVDVTKLVSDENAISDRNAIADAILKALRITYSPDSQTFSQEVRIVASYKDTSAGIADVSSTYADVKFKYDGTNIVADTNYIYLGEYEHVFSNDSLNIADYNYKIYHLNGIAADGVLIEDTSKENSENTEVTNFFSKNEGEDIINTTTIPVLKVTSAAEGVKVILKTKHAEGTSDELKVEEVSSSGKSLIYLTATGFKGKTVELFTGLCSETATGYKIYDPNATPAETPLVCFNGLLLKQVKAAKCIDSIYVGDTEIPDDSSITKTLEDTSFSTDKNGVLYQEVSINLAVILGTQIKYVEENETIRVTLKYTGIDTSNAYVGNDSMHQVVVGVVPGTLVNYVTVEDDTITNYKLKEKIEIELTTWSDAFKLIPGVGRVAELTQYTEAGKLDINSNASSLVFKLLSVTNSAGETQSGTAVVEISSTGAITLKTGYDLYSYYVTIEVSCKYPIEVASKYKPIGQIRLAFSVKESAGE